MTVLHKTQSLYLWGSQYGKQLSDKRLQGVFTYISPIILPTTWSKIYIFLFLPITKAQHRRLTFLRSHSPQVIGLRYKLGCFPLKSHTLAAKSCFSKVTDSSELTGSWQVHIQRYKRNLVSSVLCYQPLSRMCVNHSAVFKSVNNGF